ncbi:hypothetical protein [Cetobacterium sp.]|uniref:hypothetical protein n=1 Tax=Cetobacterium sp. TaxID=2071632 RepID=UPI003F318201
MEEITIKKIGFLNEGKKITIEEFLKNIKTVTFESYSLILAKPRGRRKHYYYLDILECLGLKNDDYKNLFKYSAEYRKEILKEYYKKSYLDFEEAKKIYQYLNSDSEWVKTDDIDISFISVKK